MLIEKMEVNNETSGEQKSLPPYSCDQCDKSYQYEFSLKRHIKAKHTDKTEPHLNQRIFVIECNLCKEVFRSQELKAKHFESFHMPLVRNWFDKKRDEVQSSKFECKICKKKFLFENSMKVHMTTRCNKENVPKVITNGVCEELETRKSFLEVEEENCGKASSEPARHQTKLPAFHESEPSTVTHTLKNSQKSMFVVNEILGTVLENVMEVHLDKVTEDFYVVDENGEDIEDIGKDLQYGASDKSLMVNFSSGIGFEGLTSETLMESTRKSSKKRLVVEHESTKVIEAMTVRIPTKRSCPFVTSPPYCIFPNKEGHAVEGGQELCADGGVET